MSDNENVHQGWAAADLSADDLVDDDWIAQNTRPGKRPRRSRLIARSLTPKRLQRTPITRDQMRRIAQRTGYPYTEAWSGHNKGAMKGAWGALCHHTGTPWSAAGDYPTLRVVRDGRPGLVNALCNFGLGKSGRIYLVTEKTAWHAGAGEYAGLTDGNGHLLGIEAESDGGAGHWTAQQVDAYPKLVAAILVEINQDDRYTTRHASWALPRGRKTDFAGWPGGTEAFWKAVYHWIGVYKGQPAPAPQPPAPDQPWLRLPNLVKGQAGPAVLSWQKWYNAYPFKPALLPIISPVSQNFGPQTEAAIKKVQARYGLPADGIVGPRTKKLFWDLGWRG